LLFPVFNALENYSTTLLRTMLNEAKCTDYKKPKQ
jgi:hypothetical protein